MQQQETSWLSVCSEMNREMEKKKDKIGEKQLLIQQRSEASEQNQRF